MNYRSSIFSLRAFFVILALCALLFTPFSRSSQAAPFTEMRFYKISGPGYYGVVPSYIAAPGETIDGFAHAGLYESTNKVTRVTLLLDNKIIGETNGLDVYLTVPFSLTFTNSGE
ncbi:MAG TPA: hypothetical protein VM680_00815, partial [Verrucomicrobiae bacterium]|nr:hypothetical protein [Verrucomicrobiae bacterium]